MDMSSLQSGLPRASADPINLAFKEAALSLTTLYKASQQSRQAGYLDAIDEICTLFLDDVHGVDLPRMKRWIEDRRRTINPGTTEGNNTNKDEQFGDDFETEPVPMPMPVPIPHSTPLTNANNNINSAATTSSAGSPRRTRIGSPVRRHTRPDPESRGADVEGRRDWNNHKRRVLGGVDVVADFHKRGRFG